jgi:hypothetical protein
LKRVLGIFYPKGAYGPSIRFARNHPDLDDERAEKLLAEYTRVSDLGIVIVLVGTLLGAIGFSAASCLLSLLFGWW